MSNTIKHSISTSIAEEIIKTDFYKSFLTYRNDL